MKQEYKERFKPYVPNPELNGALFRHGESHCHEVIEEYTKAIEEAAETSPAIHDAKEILISLANRMWAQSAYDRRIANAAGNAAWYLRSLCFIIPAVAVPIIALLAVIAFK